VDVLLSIFHKFLFSLHYVGALTFPVVPGLVCVDVL
jgi:hypothetical protein